MAEVFDALSHPTRRSILELLKAGSRSAGEIADAFPLAKSTISAHLAKLKEAGLIQADQRGTTILYSINLSVLEEVLLAFMARVGSSAELKGEVR